MHNFSRVRNTFSNLITWDLKIENKYAMILGPMEYHVTVQISELMIE